MMSDKFEWRKGQPFPKREAREPNPVPLEDRVLAFVAVAALLIGPALAIFSIATQK